VGTQREPHRQPVVNRTDNRVFRARALDRPFLTLFSFSPELRCYTATSRAIQAIKPQSWWNRNPGPRCRARTSGDRFRELGERIDQET
jgi:hypothetical protein